MFPAWLPVCNRGCREAELPRSPWFPLAFTIFWYAFLLLFPITFTSMVAYEDFVLNAYLWVLLGICFRLPRLALAPQNASGRALATEPQLRRIR